VPLQKAAAAVKKYKSFLITAHTNLEGDALGSELAFYRLVRKMGKSALIVNEDSLPYGYDFLPDKDKINRLDRYARRFKFECLAVLDCSDLRRTGEVYRLNSGHKPILNIDHHISNEKFGQVNWVEPYASSCAEMVFKLYKKLGVPLDRESATCLYTGIMADTGSFRYPNATASTHRIAAELLKFKLDIPFIYKNVYENIPFADMQLLIKILPCIRREAKGRLAWCTIRQSLLRNKKLSFDLTEHILSFARAIKDVEVVALFKKNLGVKDEIRVNLRSQGKVDVNKIASCFGGGGHRTASGATIHGKLDSVRKKVLAKIKENL
jgi:phosphoesterase RecJ-like protein